MMKKTAALLLSLVMLIGMLPSALAAESTPTFQLQLTAQTAGGSVADSIQIGDVVTFTVAVKRTDAAEAYKMFLFQDEIYYQTRYFELVPDSIQIDSAAENFQKGFRDGIDSDTMARVQMNYVSYGLAGAMRPEDMTIGTFQLKAIKAGTAKIESKNVFLHAQEMNRACAVTVSDCKQITISSKDAGGNTGGGGTSAGGGGESAETTRVLELSAPVSGQVIIAPSMLSQKDAVMINGAASIYFAEDAVKKMRKCQENITVTLQKETGSHYTKAVYAQFDSGGIYSLKVSAETVKLQFDAGDIVLQAAAKEGGGRPVAYALSENQSWSKIQGQTQTKEMTAVAIQPGMTIGLMYVNQAFTDVGTWCEGYVNTLYNLGIMKGIDGEHFGTNKFMKRSELVATLARISGDPMPAATTIFSDVKPTDWFAKDVAWAVANGVTGGTSQSTFSPTQEITREQFATMLSRFAKYMKCKLTIEKEPTVFADDRNISGFADQAVKEMQCAGIINGKDGNRFDPQGYATRGECAKMLSILLQDIKVK